MCARTGCIAQQRTYLGRVPKTTVRATAEGRRRLVRHAEALRMIVEGTPAADVQSAPELGTQ